MPICHARSVKNLFSEGANITYSVPSRTHNRPADWAFARSQSGITPRPRSESLRNLRAVRYLSAPLIRCEPHEQPAHHLCVILTFDIIREAFGQAVSVMETDQQLPFMSTGVQLQIRGGCLNTPGRIRTCDLMLRRHALYPAELRVRVFQPFIVSGRLCRVNADRRVTASVADRSFPSAIASARHRAL